MNHILKYENNQKINDIANLSSLIGLKGLCYIVTEKKMHYQFSAHLFRRFGKSALCIIYIVANGLVRFLNR